MTPEEETFITLQEPAPIIDNNGTKRWYNDKLNYHRENDLPAVIYRDGGKCWYKHGKLHRENDLPAIITIKGDKHWYNEGHLHRENNLPAVVLMTDLFNKNVEYWYIDGEFIK